MFSPLVAGLGFDGQLAKVLVDLEARIVPSGYIRVIISRRVVFELSISSA
jgi:hypothetical protein